MKSSLVGNTHLLSGGPEIIPEILSLLQGEGIKTRANPDVYVREYKHFGIDEARELRERAILRPLGKRRIFVIATPELNREAQNALLKTIEEPPSDALFFFALPAPESLLPTFRSRAHMVDLVGRPRQGRLESPVAAILITSFLAASPQKRLEMLRVLLEKGEDNKRDLGAILAFLTSLEKRLEKDPEGLSAVYRARKYVSDKGALVKPLLEQVALLVPRA